MYKILIKYGVHMKLVSLIKMFLIETFIKVHADKYLLIIFLFKIVQNKISFVAIALQRYCGICLRKCQENLVRLN
jgi:hypothetical protein